VDLTDYRRIAVTREGPVTTVTLDRPERRNAVDDVMHSALTTIFTDLRRDRTTRAVVLTGAGSAFCVGGDSGPDRTFTTGTGLTPVEEAARIVQELVELHVPIVAAVNGDAFGLGAVLATLCDAAFVDAGARLGDAHVRGGVTAGNGSAALWPALIGVNRAKHLLLGSRLVDAAEAARLGLVTAAVPAGQALPAAVEQAGQWAAAPPFALQSTKRILNRHLKAAIADALEIGLAWEQQALDGTEFRNARVRHTSKALETGPQAVDPAGT
jgi:enoyl-CoA hydratase